MWSRIKSPRPKRAAGSYQLTHVTVSDTSEEMISENGTKENVQKVILPPRYRFRDLLLGDFAFNDDGER